MECLEIRIYQLISDKLAVFRAYCGKSVICIQKVSVFVIEIVCIIFKTHCNEIIILLRVRHRILSYVSLGNFF